MGGKIEEWRELLNGDCGRSVCFGAAHLDRDGQGQLGGSGAFYTCGVQLCVEPDVRTKTLVRDRCASGVILSRTDPLRNPFPHSGIGIGVPAESAREGIHAPAEGNLET